MIAGFLDLEVPEYTGMQKTMCRPGSELQEIYRENGCCFFGAGKETGPHTLQWEGETCTAVFAGRIYNEPELKQELESLGHSTVTGDPADLFLHCFAQWGTRALEKINGVFAAAVREHRNQRVTLVRDRIGVYPLFYRMEGKGLIFGSEMKTILSFPGIRPELDREGMFQLILLGPGRLPGSGVFRGMKELEPGCWARFQGGELELCRYWKLRDRGHEESFGETSDRVRWLVADAIRRQIPEDRSFGTFLSGGLDSSIISALCRREGLRTFSVDYLNNDLYFRPGRFQPDSDGDYIRIMSEFLGSRHRMSLLTAHDLFDNLEAAAWARDLPGMADVDSSLLVFSREVRRDVEVALSGECADEIFGGYPWYRDQSIRCREGFPWARNTQARASLLRQKEEAEEFVMDAYRDTCRESDILPEALPEDRRIREMVNLNFRWFMQTLLDRNDRMSRFSGLEVRVPFCDYRIAEYLYSVPWAMKDWGGREKGLLRHAFRDLLPEKILRRKKSPYPKTFDPGYGELVGKKMELLLKSDSPLWDFLDQNAVIALGASENSWPWYGQLMQKPQFFGFLIQLDWWLRNWNIQIKK